MTENVREPSTVVITGASGMVGRALSRSLQQDGVRVVRLVRGRGEVGADARFWAPGDGVLDPAHLADADAVVHLAGANIGDKRWTAAVKRDVLESRVQGTRLIAQTLAGMTGARPAALISASAVGYYGDTGARTVDEGGPLGTGFLAEVCEAWEGALAPARDAGVRVAVARLGVILDGQGGALSKMITPFKLGVGGVVGSGRQGFPWVSLHDVVRAFRFLLAHPKLRGPFNVVGPELLDNAGFTRTLGALLHRPTVLPLPGFLARAGLGGEMATELLLQGQLVTPTALLDAGFVFDDAELRAALTRALAK
ncbi:MAG: TIGR01777 family protein [Sandaracinaceae bacterium]|nr:TIGR01777 family protein [Sandaracinaceae bacterium]MBK8588553.1 TIGR01777 family protein [Sandaracinaceae bacterium]